MSNVRVLGLVRDLLFKTKIDATAESLGVVLVYASALDAARARCAEQEPAVILVDLSDQSFPSKETVIEMREAAPHAKLIGFASHVNLKVMKSARGAGFDSVLSRQEFTARLPELLKP